MTDLSQDLSKKIGEAARDGARDVAADLAEELAASLGTKPEVVPTAEGADLVLPSREAAKSFGLMLAARSLRRMASAISTNVARALRGPRS